MQHSHIEIESEKTALWSLLKLFMILEYDNRNNLSEKQIMGYVIQLAALECVVLFNQVVSSAVYYYYVP
jgi:hypothetical protein